MADSQVKALTTKGLLDSIRKHNLLSQARVEEATREAARLTDGRAFARWLMERDWVTPYQINRLQKGQVADLILGPYLLMEPLADEATGQVFKARHRVLNRVVSMKIIRRELAAKLDADAVRRFYAEVEVLARLDYPQVGHAFDAGPVGTTHFVAAEYVDGMDLEAMVKKQGALPIPQAVDYIGQIALGLQYLYQNGVVHHNLHPSNVLVTRASGGSDVASPTPRPAPTPGVAELGTKRYPHGLVKLFNMGLSTLAAKAKAEAVAPAGAVKDEADYSAPEYAIDPQRADIRADLYSLGCIFYLLLTAREPIGRARREGADLLKQLRPDVPEKIVGVVRRLLAGQPDERYAAPSEVATALGVSLGSSALSGVMSIAGIRGAIPAPPAAPPAAPPVPPPPPAPPPAPPPWLRPPSGEKATPADWDAITTGTAAEGAAPARRSALSLRTLLILGGLMALGGFVGLGILALALTRSGPKKPTEGELSSNYRADLQHELSRREPSGWVPLRPVKFTSQNGQTLRLLDDYSVLASGKAPDTDVYTVTLRTVQKQITGLRLEAISDPSLPGQKMSRFSNGNFVLTRIQVDASSEGDAARPVKMARAAADFVQKDHSIESVIDKGTPGWAVLDGAAVPPGVPAGQTRHAMFVLAEPIPGGPGTILTVRLRFESPHKLHIAGRIRLSITTIEDPKLE